jgi:hypothetical protein
LVIFFWYKNEIKFALEKLLYRDQEGAFTIDAHMGVRGKGDEIKNVKNWFIQMQYIDKIWNPPGNFSGKT